MEGQVTLRNFTLSDLSYVMEIERICFGEEAFSSHYFNYLHHRYPDTFIVGEFDNKIVGYVIGREEITDDDLLLPSESITIINQDHANKTGDIISLAIKPEHRRKGIAYLLIHYILEKLQKFRVKLVILMVKATNTPAINLYKKAGFRIKKLIENYYKPKSDGYLMVHRF
jgi:ribosomal-protein-alanine N-acetyltransferase